MKSNVFICPPCGESVAGATKEGQKKEYTLWPLLPRLTAVLPPQGREMSFGFTLIELVIAVLIIGILAAVAVPMYKHAVLKSRFTTMMPMAKSVADAQEVYYLGNGQYAIRKSALDVTPVSAENTTVEISGEAQNADDEYVYVIASRSDVPGARYIQYQKNSPNYAGNTYCEAAEDEEAKWLCEKGLGGQEQDYSMNDGYTLYLLSGDSAGEPFAGGGTGGNEPGTSDEPGENPGTNPVEENTPVNTRLPKGDPTCSWTNEVSEACLYEYGTGETLASYSNWGVFLYCSCDRQQCCGPYHANGNNAGSYTQFDWKDETGTYDEVYYDETGHVYGARLVRNGITLFYDANGELLSNTTPPSGLSSELRQQFDAMAQSLVGKTKCQLYPELKECSSGN